MCRTPTIHLSSAGVPLQRSTLQDIICLSIMASEQFQFFLKERNQILQDIEQFLFTTFRYFLMMENEEYRTPLFATETVGSLIKSLCLIHGLYGYPGPNPSANSITGKNTL